MNFLPTWHPFRVARHWPTGSAVLVRTLLTKQSFHKFSYILTLHFIPESNQWDDKSEYQLVEEPAKQTQ